MITTLTRAWLEDLTDYMKELGIHWQNICIRIFDDMERAEIIRDLRLDVFDVLVCPGNTKEKGWMTKVPHLWRLLDADKEGFFNVLRHIPGSRPLDVRSVTART